MLIAFTLTMPNRASWNGGWSGAERPHVLVRNLKELPAKANHYYDFGDGWGANVAVQRVTVTEAKNLRKKSVGFSGYDWMVDEIVQLGRIRPLGERVAKSPAAVAP